MTDKKPTLQDLFSAVEEQKRLKNFTLDDFFGAITEEKSKNPQAHIEPIKEPVIIPTVFSEPEAIIKTKAEPSNDLIEATLGILAGSSSQKTQDPLTPINQKFVTFDDLQKHYKTFVERVQIQLSTLGGGGEVEFLKLDDVQNKTARDNWVLEYDAQSGSVKFTDEVGPINSVAFNINHVKNGETEGTIFWNATDRTLDIKHSNDVVQQVGQESYALIKNRTGSTIPNGTVVRFSGAETDRLNVAPFRGNGVYPNLYVLGVATHDIQNDSDGFVTNWGRVSGLNTSKFNVGDILYVSPDSDGKFVNVKPTAPNNVIPVAAGLIKDSDEGEIFVRPTIEQRKTYASFSDSDNQAALLINHPYSIRFNTTDIASGHYTDLDDSARRTKIVSEISGLYNYQFSLQFVSTNASAKDVYVWPRKNGQDIANSATRLSVTGNNVHFVAAWNFLLSMNSNDYFQLMWATTNASVSIVSPATNAFSPAIPSVILTITEAAL